MAIDPKTLINTGGQENDGTGDSIRVAFDKANFLFQDIDTKIAIVAGGGVIPGINYLNSLTNLFNAANATGTSIRNLTTVVNGLINTANSTGTSLATLTRTTNSLTNSVSSLTNRVVRLENATTGTAGYTNLVTIINNNTQSFTQLVQNLTSNFYSTSSLSVSSYNQVITLINDSTSSFTQYIQNLSSSFSNTGTLSTSSYNQVITLINNSTTSIANRIDTLDAKFNTLTTGSGATISYVDNAVASSTGSLASSLQSLTTDFSTPGRLTGAAYTGLTTLISNSTGSFASDITTLKINYTNLANSVTTFGTYTNSIVGAATSSSQAWNLAQTVSAQFTQLTTGSGATVEYVTNVVASSTASITTDLTNFKNSFKNPGGLADAGFTELTTLVANSTGSLATRIATLEASSGGPTGGGFATVTYVDTAVTNSTSTLASSVQTIISTVSNHTTSIRTNAESINGLQGKYGVTINNNGAISGFQINSGAVGASSFIVQADKFAIETSGAAITPFSVTGSTVTMTNVNITGDLLTNGTITTNKIIVNGVTETEIVRTTRNDFVGPGPDRGLDSEPVTVSGFVGGFIMVVGNSTLGEGGYISIFKTVGPNGYWSARSAVESGTGQLESPRIADLAAYGYDTNNTCYWVPLVDGDVTFITRHTIPGTSDPIIVDGTISTLATTFKR
jgi:hypothetical protein